jgi:hypothetical protein
VALAGPRFSWDRASEWLLPPAELMTMRGEISRRLAARSASRSARRSTRRFFERLSFWRMTAPTRVAAVSGAVMAIEKSAWKRVGGFDERYRLYYEEIDFMRALAREGLGVLHVPDARCRHLYDQSAAGAAEHREKFAESEALYLRKWHGATASLLGLLEGGRGFGLPPAALLGRSEAFAIPASPEAHVVEASPLESFDTAAGHFAVSGDARIPAEILESYHGGALFVRVVEAATGREVSRRVLRDSA